MRLMKKKQISDNNKGGGGSFINKSKKSSSLSNSNQKSAERAGVPNNAAAYLESLKNPEIVERVFCKINDGHVFKLPPRQQAGRGWRGADWKNEVWQGMVKVVERESLIVVLLCEKQPPYNIFAVCPIQDEIGCVERCVDSSRYFVLRVQNGKDGRHMFIGIAFNERNDAFDFNVALEDAKKGQRKASISPSLQLSQACPTITMNKDYSLKAGEKIKVAVPKTKQSSPDSKRSSSSSNRPKGGGTGGLILKPHKNDSKPVSKRNLGAVNTNTEGKSSPRFDTTFGEDDKGKQATNTAPSSSSPLDIGYQAFWSLVGEKSSTLFG